MRTIAFITVLAIGAAAASCAPATPQKSAAAQPAAAAPIREVSLDAAAEKEAGITAEAAVARSVPETLRANGRITLNENRTWRIGAITDGRIIRVFCNVGDRVARGQVLARMHSHDIHEARALYRKATSDVARLTAAELYARRVRERARRLLELKAASLEQVEHAESEWKSAQAALTSAQVELERTRQHMVEFLEISLEEPKDHAAGMQEPDADLIPIKSPAAGVVLTRNVTPGTVVVPSGDLFVVTDLSTVWMIASMGEEHLARLREGMPVCVFVQAWGNQPFNGRITNIAEELDATTRMVKVRVEVPNAGGKLKPEMYATAEIAVGGSERALFVPQDAVQEVSGQPSVFIRSGGGKFEVRPVQTGRRLDALVEISSGLRGGEAVVTRGSFLLKSQLLKSALQERE